MTFWQQPCSRPSPCTVWSSSCLPLRLSSTIQPRLCLRTRPTISLLLAVRCIHRHELQLFWFDVRRDRRRRHCKPSDRKSPLESSRHWSWSYVCRIIAAMLVLLTVPHLVTKGLWIRLFRVLPRTLRIPFMTGITLPSRNQVSMAGC